MRSTLNIPPLWLWLLAAAGLGVGLMLVLTWRASTLETLGPGQAAERLAGIRTESDFTQPLLRRDSTGSLIRTPVPAGDRQEAPTQLVLVVYRPDTGGFLRVEVPFWLLTVKGPLLSGMLRSAAFDIEELAMSPGDLRALGGRAILDETRTDGSVLLVWTR